MRLVVWGINYAPEFAGIAPYNTALCEFLRARGHHVKMVTTFPYYPAWQKRKEDQGRIFQREELRGVQVDRCWHYVPARPSALRRMFHEASFVTTSFLRLLLSPAPDAFIVISPPLLLGAAAWLLSRCKRKNYVFHVQDLQPDAAMGLGLLKTGPLLKALFWLEAFAYRHAISVSGITVGMLGAFTCKGVPADKILFFPNGVTLRSNDQLPSYGKFRRRMKFRDSDFLAVYSGNLGVKQGLDVLVKAAGLLTRPQIRLLICGDGAVRSELAARIAKERLQNIDLLPFQPEQQFLELLRDADVSVITQQPGAGACFFPSKLLTSLSFGKPILSVADENSELARAVREGSFGLNVVPGYPGKVAAALGYLADNPVLLHGLGTAGRKYVEQFNLDHTLVEFEQYLCALLKPKQTA